MPLSGAAGGEFSGDILLPDGLRVEVKARRDGFRLIYRWLGNADILAVKADRKPWLVVLPLERFLALAKAGGKAHDAG